ncbi:MAG: histidine kinase [Burkholderiales bacterium]|nr:histidine kinase [Burkholderiales bacterium]
MNPTQPRHSNPLPSYTAADEHPLELFAFFRRWRPSLVRDLVYTFILGLAFGLFFFALFAPSLADGGWGLHLWHTFVVAMAIAYTIHGLYVLGDRMLARWLHRARGWQRAIYHIALPTAGVFAGYGIAISLLSDPIAVLRHIGDIFTPGVVQGVAVMAVMVSGGVLFAYITRLRELLERERVAAEQRRVLEAQLRMLQAQIEPHFLYNTLANAVGLIQPAPERAQLLLERLIDYLRATLAASRGVELPLRGEIDTLTAYLELMKVRMGDRLRYRIELAEAAAGLSLPPMLLQPIVENAISHGLEPKIEGGEIVLTAAVEANELRIVIRDTGAGFRPDAPRKPGGGVGLANLRERIAALYGREGGLSLTDNSDGGVCVTLRIPMSRLAPGQAG